MELYQRAIESNQIPHRLGFSLWSRSVSILAVGVGCFILYKLHFTGWFNQFRGRPGYAPSGLIDALGLFLIVIGTYGFISVRTVLSLTFHPSFASIVQKERIIEQLKSHFGWYGSGADKNYRRFLEPHTILDMVTVIYDEKGYYLNEFGTSIYGGWIGFGKRRKNVNQIIQRIIQLENNNF